MDRGAWQAAVHRAAKSPTRLTELEPMHYSESPRSGATGVPGTQRIPRKPRKHAAPKTIAEKVLLNSWKSPCCPAGFPRLLSVGHTRQNGGLYFTRAESEMQELRHKNAHF